MTGEAGVLRVEVESRDQGLDLGADVPAKSGTAEKDLPGVVAADRVVLKRL